MERVHISVSGLEEYLITNLRSGRISEIYDAAQSFFGKNPQALPAEAKAQILCAAMRITMEDLDVIIAGHSEVTRTVKGHAFEVVFDSMMQLNGVTCIEVGGDSDVDRIINGRTLQLKTPYVKGCSEGIVSYKTHKTHGAKSQTESFDYYHKIEDFADYLVGLVSYDPFHVLIVPKQHLPQVTGHGDYIESPMYLPTDRLWMDNYAALGIHEPMHFSTGSLEPSIDECLPSASSLLQLKSDYILRAIFIKDNFRIWDMNMRGFIREHILTKLLAANGIRTYPAGVTGLERADKCDLVLKNNSNHFVRFQVKGLTWKGTSFRGSDTTIDCETQLSRGRVNDHPTQSRLYMTTDFDYLIIAIDPPYSNQLSLATFGQGDYNWNFYCVPMPHLRTHPIYIRRVFSHQYIPFLKLQEYKIGRQWLSGWAHEL